MSPTLLRPLLLLSLLTFLLTLTPVRAAECFPELRTGPYLNFVDKEIWNVRVRICNASGSSECPNEVGSWCELSGPADENGIFAKGIRRGGVKGVENPWSFCLNATRDIIEGCWKAPLRRMGGSWTEGDEHYELALFHINDTEQKTTTGLLDPNYTPTTTLSASSRASTTSHAVTTTGTGTTGGQTNSPNNGTNSDSTPTPSPLTSSSGGLSAGATAGIAVGSTLGVLAVVGIAFLFFRRHKRAKARAAASDFITQNIGSGPDPSKIPSTPFPPTAGYYGGSDEENLAKKSSNDGTNVAGSYMNKDPQEVSGYIPARELAANEVVGGELYGSQGAVEMDAGEGGLGHGLVAAKADQEDLQPPPPVYNESSAPAVPGGPRDPTRGEGEREMEELNRI